MGRLKATMPHWHWEQPPPDWSAGIGSLRTDQPIDAVIVFAKPNDEKRALALCQEIRNRPELASIPLLVAINRYQLSLGNDVRRLPNAHFILTPIEEQRLESKLEEMGSELASG